MPCSSQPGRGCVPQARDSAITEPWKQRLKALSPLSNRPATVKNFAPNVYRSRNWLDKQKGRSGALPVQCHDAHYATDSHFLRGFSDATGARQVKPIGFQVLLNLLKDAGRKPVWHPG